MTDGLLVIVSSGEEAREKAYTGMLYAINARKFNWIENVSLIFFGPSEEMMTRADPELSGMLKQSIELGITPFACSSYASRKNITEPLEDIGFSVDPVGPIISAYIKKGYEVLTF